MQPCLQKLAASSCMWMHVRSRKLDTTTPANLAHARTHARNEAAAHFNPAAAANLSARARTHARNEAPARTQRNISAARPPPPHAPCCTALHAPQLPIHGPDKPQKRLDRIVRRRMVRHAPSCPAADYRAPAKGRPSTNLDMNETGPGVSPGAAHRLARTVLSGSSFLYAHAVYRRKHLPGAVRPARPDRCCAAALEICEEKKMLSL